ncbi:2-phospho-L-lactate guanylyltransferase [Sphingomonas sp. YR710]|uniref:2-phospho-L-lactate guanylyltransferase n=1 Tax=Sphingomonas sp. YR710 TaxID=1882773 RepID=UPI000886C0F8|nr:2-phospho-L-lactate guanylyltransferase [Sphingomonas sp. YR710]SDC66104.1 2-phospho-L-lactate guanylyltransferase [Sphingomonas sp. YR710]
MIWTAIVPIKRGMNRKSRLAEHLSQDERQRLSDHLAVRVLDRLVRSPSVGRVLVLSETAHDDPAYGWLADKGRGLNAELADARAVIAAPVIIIHGDLPLIESDDIAALIAAAGTDGVAIAPDRHDDGTNALALASAAPFAFAFGEGSCARHRAAAGSTGAIVRRPGLAHDIDTPDDLAAARAVGFAWPAS